MNNDKYNVITSSWFKNDLKECIDNVNKTNDINKINYVIDKFEENKNLNTYYLDIASDIRKQCNSYDELLEYWEYMKEINYKLYQAIYDVFTNIMNDIVD